MPVNLFNASLGTIHQPEIVLYTAEGTSQFSSPVFTYSRQLNDNGPDLAIVAKQANVYSGGVVDFVLAASNDSSQTMQNLMLVTDIPAGMSVSYSANADGVTAPIVAENKAYWLIGDLTAGSIVKRELTLTVDSTVPGDILVTEASIVSAGHISELVSAREYTRVISTEQPDFDFEPWIEESLSTVVTFDLDLNVATKDSAVSDIVVRALTGYGYYLYSNEEKGFTCEGNCQPNHWGAWHVGSLSPFSSDAIQVAGRTPAWHRESSALRVGQLSLGTLTISYDSTVVVESRKHYIASRGEEFEVSPLHDSDGDGIPDYWELQNAGLANWQDASDAVNDADGDGYTNKEEYELGQSLTYVDPRDTDGDGIYDHIELALGLDIYGSDSDGDGFEDGVDNFPSVAQPFTPSVLDVLLPGDVNADQTDDFIVVKQDGAGIVSADVISGNNLVTLSTVKWHRPYQNAKAFLLKSETSTTGFDIGVFGMFLADENTLKPRLFVKRITDGTNVQVITWPETRIENVPVLLSDMNDDGLPEFGVQGKFIEEGMRPQLFVNDVTNGREIGFYSFPDYLHDPKYLSLSDFNGDGVDEIGLFGRLKKNNKIQIKIVDGTDPDNRLVAYNFPDKWDDVTWFRLSDINFDYQDDFGMFGIRKEDNRPQLFTKSGVDHTGTLGIFGWPEDLSDAKFLLVPDMNYDGVDDFAVVGRTLDSSRYVIIIKDGADRSNVLSNYGLPHIDETATFGVLPSTTSIDDDKIFMFSEIKPSVWDVRTSSFRAISRVNWESTPKVVATDLNSDLRPEFILYGVKDGNAFWQVLDNLREM